MKSIRKQFFLVQYLFIPDGASACPDSASLPAECKVRKVSSFREKPDLETAKQYLKAGSLSAA